MNRSLVAAFMFLVAAPVAQADEPEYCSPETFGMRELPYADTRIERERVFQLGSVRIAGAAIGHSDPAAVKAMAAKLARERPRPEDGHCTWYLNRGNSGAEAEFNHRHLNHPMSNPVPKTAEEYSSRLGPELDAAVPSFLSCAERYGYIALGCQGQKHRGPSAFAMLLAYSGCSPESSVAIANRIWGRNGVSDEVRLAIARKGKELARARPELSGRLRELFSAD
jgi:hypothetical protein